MIEKLREGKINIKHRFSYIFSYFSGRLTICNIKRCYFLINKLLKKICFILSSDYLKIQKKIFLFIQYNLH